MPYKLITHPPSGGESIDRHYAQASLSIGRDEKSDLTLIDTRHLVSRRHVEIKEREGAFWIVDLESKNGTRLNKKKLSPGKEYRLSEGDQISIGSFLIDFVPSPPEPDPETAPSPVSPDHTEARPLNTGLDHEEDHLVSEMNRVYCNLLELSAYDRNVELKKVLKEAVRGRSLRESERLLRALESAYWVPDLKAPLIAEVTQNEVTQNEETSVVEASSNACQDGYDGLLKIARCYFEDVGFLTAPGEMTQFVERLGHVLSVMTTSLAKALKGRRLFEEEFDVDATRVLSWKLNPVKESETGEEIGRYVLDWRTESRAGGAISDLEESFNDLALHHLGLIAGFKACINGLLDQLNPDLIEIDGQKGLGGVLGLEPMRSRSAWKLYREKYRQLREEEVKTFETILGPYIAEGYLSIQKKRRVL